MKKIKRILTTLLISVMALTNINISQFQVFADTNSDKKAFMESGDGSLGNPYKISDSSTLYGFLDASNSDQNTFKGKYIIVTDSIYANDISDYSEWSYTVKPENIWNGINNFEGHFDGNNYTIYGLYIEDDNGNIGFFDNVKGGANISNIRLEKSFLNVSTHTIDDKNGNITNAAYSAGMLAGDGEMSSLSNCCVSGEICVDNNIPAGMNIGGFVGYSYTSGNITGCQFNGEIKYNNEDSNYQLNSAFAGGIIGRIDLGYDAGARNIYDCFVAGKVNLPGFEIVGGIIGRYYSADDTNQAYIKQCGNFGYVHGNVLVGGICGYAQSLSSISNCFNKGNVQGSSSVGGIVGNTWNAFSTTEIKNCYNTGDIGLSETSLSGGIVGYAWTGTIGTIKIHESYSLGKVNGYNAGVVGKVSFNGWSFSEIYLANIYYSGVEKIEAYTSGDAQVNSIKNVEKISSENIGNQNFYSGFDFDNIWIINKEQPRLRWEISSLPAMQMEEFKLTGELPTMSVGKNDEERQKMAKAYLCFITNSKEKAFDKINESNDYVKLITGTYEGTDEEKYILASSLLEIVNSNIEEFSDCGQKNKEKLSEEIVKYLETKAGSGDLASDAVNSAWKKFVGSIKSLIVTTLEDNGEKASNLFTAFDAVSEIKGAPSKAKDYVEGLIAAVQGVGLITNSEYTGRYKYFNEYLRLREIFDKDSDEFKMAISYSEFVESDNNYLSELIPYITLGTKSSWNKNIDIINEWAEYTFQLSEFIFAQEHDTPVVTSAIFQDFTRNIIQCPVDIDILDDYGNVLASIKNDEIVQPVTDSNKDKIFVAVYGDIKDVVINNNVKCHIKIIATDDGSLNYSSREVKDGVNEIVNNTYNIPLKKDEVFEVKERQETENTTSYPIVEKIENGSKIEIKPDDSMTKQTLEKIDVDISENGNGTVIGEGEYLKGTPVILNAIPEDENLFDGWYENEKKLSDNTIYKFTAKKDRNIIAVFKQKTDSNDSDTKTDIGSSSGGISEDTSNTSGNSSTNDSIGGNTNSSGSTDESISSLIGGESSGSDSTSESNNGSDTKITTESDDGTDKSDNNANSNNIESNTDNSTETDEDEKASTVSNGSLIKDSKTKAIYKILSKNKVAYFKPSNKQSKIVTVYSTISYGRVEYKVTEIAANAFKNDKKLEKITIGKNIEKINKNAFYGCTKLKQVIFKTTRIKYIDKTAFHKCSNIRRVSLLKKNYTKQKKIVSAVIKASKKTATIFV